MGNYTNLVEGALFNWDFDEGDDIDDKTLIDMLNCHDVFRTFGEGVLYFLQKRNPETTTETASKYLKELCDKTNVPIDDIATRNTRSNWFRKGMRPDKGDTNRKRIFALAFALQLTPEETAELFHKVYLDRAFDYRNIVDVVCYFCLANKKTWQDANRIIDSINESCFNNDDHTVYTSQIEKDITSIDDESQLIEYIKAHGHNFSQRNVKALHRREQLILEATKWAIEEVPLQKHREEAKKSGESVFDYFENIEEGKISTFYGCNEKSYNHLFEVILDQRVHIREGRGTMTLFKNARLPQEIKNRMPEAHSLSKLNPTYEELRKLIILLFSYIFWHNINKEVIINKKEDGIKAESTDKLPEMLIFSPEDVSEYFDDYKENINAMLIDCGFAPMYAGNPYDWLFLFCTLSKDPLQLFRDIIYDALEEDRFNNE